MDLASFISGIGPTKAFAPGSTTPAPFNVPHIGLTDGTSPATASSNMAEIYNRILLQIAATIVGSGLTMDNNNWAQLFPAVTAIADARAAISGFLRPDVAAATYQTIVGAEGTYETLTGSATAIAGVNATIASLLTLTSSNVFVGIGTNNVVLPSAGTWRGFCIGNSGGYPLYSVFPNAIGGSAVAPTGSFTNVECLALRIA